MSDASIWTGPATDVPVINADGNLFEEVQIAAAGQTVFALTSFQYTPGTHSLFVFRKSGAQIGGGILRVGTDYTETDNSHITLTAGATVGDILTFVSIALAQAIPAYATNGLIPGGTTGQILGKASNSDYDQEWIDLTSLPVLTDGPRTNVASASTVDLTTVAATTRNLLITGNIQIDGFQIANGEVFAVKFASQLTINNNGSIVTPTGSSIKTGANDTCWIRATAANIVEIIGYCRAGSSIVPNANGGRLTLASGTPVTRNDTSGTTVYYTPYIDNKISLWNGLTWQLVEFVEVSFSLLGAANGVPYDIFAQLAGGVVSLSAVKWTSNSVRATDIVRQDNVYVLSGSPQFKYLGTVYLSSDASIHDTRRQRLVWNMYNRVTRSLLRLETSANWNYTTAVMRQANANALNQVETIAGLEEDATEVSLLSSASNTTAGVQVFNFVSLDSTTVANAEASSANPNTPGAGYQVQMAAKLCTIPAAGFHFWTWCELSTATGATTFYGSTNNNGLHGTCRA
jgi:hypothetical protein